MPVKFTNSARAFAGLSFCWISWLTWLPTVRRAPGRCKQRIRSLQSAGERSGSKSGTFPLALAQLCRVTTPWDWNLVVLLLLDITSAPRNRGVPLNLVAIFTGKGSRIWLIQGQFWSMENIWGFLVFRQSRWQISLKISKARSFSNPLTSSKNWIYVSDKDQKKKEKHDKNQMVRNVCVKWSRRHYESARNLGTLSPTN